MEKAYKLKLVKDNIKSYPDFPEPGILFRDIFGVFKNAAAAQAMTDLLLAHTSLLDFDVVIGLDSRGFLLGPLISVKSNKRFVPIRKHGKLPGKVLSQSFTLEYGEDTFDIQADAIQGKCKAIIVDDLLATGGTMAAAETLLKTSGITVVECLVVIELTHLNGRAKIEAPVHSLVQFD